MLAAPPLSSVRQKAARQAAPSWKPHPHTGKKKLILRCWYSLGDIVLLTAAVRDLHRAYPGQFLTDVRTPFDGLWLHSPWVTPQREDEAETVECDYALLEESNRAPITPFIASSST